jgi:RNA recognition motif-containing protein
MDEDENENTVSSETLNTKSTYEEQTTFNGSEKPLIDLSSSDIATEKEPETDASCPPLEGVEASMHAPQNNDKGKKKADDDMNVEDNQQAETSNTSNPEENTFIKVTKATKFSATAPWAAVPGEQTWKKIDNINHYFEKNQDYAGAKQYNLRKTRERVISIYFTSESSLATAIEEPIKSMNNLTFKAFYAQEKDIEIQQQRDKESNRTVKVSDLPLDIKSHTVKNIFSHFGPIERVGMGLSGKWQHAYVIFENADSTKEFYDQTWSIPVLGSYVRVTPVNLTEDQYKIRNQFCLKLSSFPRGTTSCDLKAILFETNAKTCVIPRDRNHEPINIAFLNFASEDDLLKITTSPPYRFQGRELYWNSPDANTCFNCGHPDHMSRDCKFRNNNNRAGPARFDRLYKRFMPEAYNPPLKNNYPARKFASYAAAAGSNDATTRKQIRDDQLICATLNRLEKQLNDLSDRIDKMDAIIEEHELRLTRIEDCIDWNELGMEPPKPRVESKDGSVIKL